MLNQAQDLADQLTAWRRDLHMYPELGFEELRTAGRVAETLEALDYRVRRHVGRTGVVAEIGSGRPVVGLRADMDALPLQDAKEVSYASQHAGVMHACGHDGHTAILLGVATLLAREPLAGTLRLIFQPAEEIEDKEGVSGAPRMIEDGAADDLDLVLALHLDAATPVGTVRISPGPRSAGVDSFYATIIGRGGHGAMPHKVVDPIYLSGQVIQGLHGIVSRRLPPFDPAVISIGSIHGGHATNIIPDRVELTGTIRFRDQQTQKKIHHEIEQVLRGVRPAGGDYELLIQPGYPPTTNHPRATTLLSETAADLLGADHVLPQLPEMGAEDFGFFVQRAPGAMFYLGCRIDGDERLHHNPRFDIDERCLPVGAAVLAEAARRAFQDGR